MMLTLNDGRSELWQWDTGRTLAVDADCSQVHFSNKVFGRSIDVDVAGGVAIIPDILLQTDKDLNVWAFVGTAGNGYTKISKTFKVNRRNKPADYVFTPTEQTTLAELVEQIGNLDELTTEAKDNLVAAINEAAKSGGGGGSFSMRVDSGYIQYSTDGGASWNDLIATAELQGPQGPKGDTGPQGEQGPKGAPGADGKTAYQYAVDGGYTGTETEFAAKLAEEYIPTPTTASVGQTIVVKAVDENGKPTEWDAADMLSVSGSGGGIHLIARVVTEVNAASIEVTGLSTTSEVFSLRIYNPGSSCGGGLNITVNGVQKSGFTGTISGTSTYQALVRAWLYRDGDALYGRSQMSNNGTNNYEWPEMGEITSIAVDSHYNDGTTKYFQTGTIFEIYEGVYPNVS